MITYIQAVILGALQGVSELFPISSLGHSVIAPALFGWRIDQSSDAFLGFLVATHLATSLVLLGFFWRDWTLVVKGVGRSLRARRIDESDTYAKIGWLIVVASAPAGAVGLLFSEELQKAFAQPRYVALFLAANGLLLFGFEKMRKAREKGAAQCAIDDGGALAGDATDAAVARTTWAGAVKVGFMQCLALVPGFSRTGMTIGGGLLTGLDHEQAARFSFLLATPIIFAAAALKLPELFSVKENSAPIGAILVGSAVSAAAAYLSITFLTRYFRTRTLVPFAIYCLVAGLVFFFAL